jgi:hypothetical protein
MRWEHVFAFAQNGTVIRYAPSPGAAIPKRPDLPMSIVQYIFELGMNDGYEFAGSYPEDAGTVIVMKRQRGPEV